MEIVNIMGSSPSFNVANAIIENLLNDIPDNEVYGCTDPEACNYDSEANVDDGSCLFTFEELYTGDYDCEVDGVYYCDDTSMCATINIEGFVVDYFDLTPWNGPHAITLEDTIGYQIDLVIWPSQWDIENDSLAFILTPPYNQVLLRAQGSISDYEGNKNLTICGPENITIIDIYGCTDPEACNYDETATADDDSCEYECDLGDVNGDGVLNVLDIVIAANMVLADEYDDIADMNEDGELNILDLVIMVNLVLYGDDTTVIDIDGNVYETIQIGEQLWMAENLKVTHYNDGDSISYPSDEDWNSFDEGQHGVYDNDPANADIYGNLYNFAVIEDERGVCPIDWHVPSDGEWAILTDYLGGDAGGKMKEEGHEHWSYWSDEITEEATNASGFTGLPAGSHGNGVYSYMGIYGYFWSSSEGNSYNAWSRGLAYDGSGVNRYNFNKQHGFSIRCLGD